MPEKIALTEGGGGWAMLRGADDLTERQRRPLMQAMGRTGVRKLEDLDDGGMSLISEVNDALILALVESWSLDLPLTADDLLDVPSKVYAELSTECFARMKDVIPDFDPTPDADSPSKPSDA